MDSPLIELSDAHIVLGSMLGDLGMTFQINTQTGAAVSEPEWAFTKRGKMIDYKNRKPQNTALSAIVALDHLPIGKRRLERELDRHERERGRTLELQEFLEFAESLRLQGLDSSFSVLRAIVYENPYARIPLRRDTFVGSYDERFGPVEAGIGRVYAGEELQALENWESGK